MGKTWTTNPQARPIFGAARRVLAIDAGTSCLKLVRAERTASGIRILERRAIDLREEGLISNEEIRSHLRKLIEEAGLEPLALALPQHLAISQVIDLPPTDPGKVRQAIEAETVQLSGLSESAIDFDYAALRPFSNHKNPFWLALCREGELRDHIDRLGLADAELVELAPGASGLIAAWLAHPDAPRLALLVDLGASHTVVTVVAEGQGVFASTFPIGGDAFRDAIAAEKHCSADVAEAVKRVHDVFSGTDVVTAAAATVDHWRKEIEQIISEWITKNPAFGAKPGEFAVVLGGGGSRQPGFIEHLNKTSELKFSPWPGDSPDAPRFATADGLARQALGAALQPTSLLPEEYRVAQKRKQNLRTLQAACAGLVALLALVLALGTWQKLSLIRRKQAWLEQARTAAETARATSAIERQLAANYARLQPALELQQHTLDTLEAFTAIQHARTNRALWFVLFADVQSYFSAPPVGKTNGTASPSWPEAAASEARPFQRGFVAELCIPEDPEATRRTLSRVVAELKEQPVFLNVDTLPVESRRPLVDSKMLLSDRTFSLALELPENQFASEQPPVENPLPAPGREPKSGPRTFRQKAEGAGGF